MPTHADLFPGFDAKTIRTEAGSTFVRVGGKGKPLLLLHGFPQTHACWHRIAPTLAKSFQVVVMDLRGYGQSSAPKSDDNHEPYSKRAMGRDCIAVMKALGHDRFAIAGHDRGARVAYRLALDHPDAITKLALLDIIPTSLMWERMDASRAMQVYHWTFLAQPAPMPENLIGRDPRGWFEHTLASWASGHNLKAFSASALADYRASFSDAKRIHAACEDYRAGATVDPEADEKDRKTGKTITCPTLILWGEAGIPAQGASPLEIWRQSFAPEATGLGIPGGHFLPEESPTETLEALKAFFKG